MSSYNYFNNFTNYFSGSWNSNYQQVELGVSEKDALPLPGIMNDIEDRSPHVTTDSSDGNGIDQEILEMETAFFKRANSEGAFSVKEKLEMIDDKLTKLGFSQSQIKVLNTLFTQERLLSILHYTPKHKQKLITKLNSDDCESILELYKEKTIKGLEEREIGKDRKYDFKRLPDPRPKYIKIGSAITTGIGAVVSGTFFPGSTPTVIMNMAVGQEVKARLKSSTMVKSVLVLAPITVAAGALAYFYPQYPVVNAIASLAATPGAFFIKGVMRAVSNDFYLEPPKDEDRHKITEDLNSAIREANKKIKRISQNATLSDD